MCGGVNKAGWAFIFAISGILLGGVSAQAADLGGDCCADLEERVSELEATTARKGNRKVSLTISGWVNEAVFLWDDGTEQNAYVGTNSLEQSRFKFAGEAKIDKDIVGRLHDRSRRRRQLVRRLGPDRPRGLAATRSRSARAIGGSRTSSSARSRSASRAARPTICLSDADGANTRNYSRRRSGLRCPRCLLHPFQRRAHRPEVGRCRCGASTTRRPARTAAAISCATTRPSSAASLPPPLGVKTTCGIPR